MRSKVALFALMAHFAAPAAGMCQDSTDASHAWEAISPTRASMALHGAWRRMDMEDTQQIVQIPCKFPDNSRVKLQRTFVLDSALSGRAIMLHADGVNYSSTVLVNGNFVAGHAGGYTPLDVLLEPGILKFGEENTLTIEIDGRLNAHSSVPAKHRPLGWQNHTGILRGVAIHAIPCVAIDGVRYRMALSNGDKRADLDFLIDVRQFRARPDSAEKPQLELLLEIWRQDGRKATATGRSQQFVLEGAAKTVRNIQLQVKNVTLWHPQNPFLYRLRISLLENGKLADVVEHRLGLRELRIDGERFILNGKPFEIKGVDWHETLDGLSQDSLEATISRTLRQARALGANTIRVVGRAAHPRFVERCSAEGVFVMQEVPLYYMNAKQVARERVRGLAQQALREMVRRDALQPAVLAWGLATNSDFQTAPARETIEALIEAQKKLDDRPAYLVMRSHSRQPVPQQVDFLLIDCFEASVLQAKAWPAVGRPVLPIIGFFVKPENVARTFRDAERRQIEAEEIQAQRLETALAYFQAQETNPGAFVHALRDWRGSLPVLAIGSASETLRHPGGLLTAGGRQRIGFRMVAAFYKGDRKPPISPNEAQPDQPFIFPLIGVSMLFIFLFFLNRDKRLRGHLRRVFIHPHGFYTDLHENRKLPVFLTILLGLLEGAIWGTLLVGGFFALKENLIFDEVLSLFAQSPQIKAALSWMIWHPGWGIACFAAAYFILITAVAVIFRIMAVFFGESLPQIQFISFVSWAGSCFLPLAILAPIFYSVISQGLYVQIALGAMLLSVIWFLFRLNRGLRVLFVLPPGRATLIFVSILAITFGLIIFYYQQTAALLDYIEYYLTLLS